jgi:hypothetical protein
MFTLTFSPVAFATGFGDYCVHLNGGDDVVYAGEANILEIWLANDALLGGMHPGVEVTVPDSIDWEEEYGQWGYVADHGRANDCWNVGGLGVPQDFDNVSPEHFVLLGAAMPGAGLPAGPSELCYSLRFTVPRYEAEIEDGFCVVPYFFPPAATWTFTDAAGGYPPDFCGQDVPSETNPVTDPVCFDIVPIVCGDADFSGFVNVTDCVYLLAYIFGGGPEPQPYIAGDVDCNDFVNISDAVYIRSYIFSGGPEPCAECP